MVKKRLFILKNSHCLNSVEKNSFWYKPHSQHLICLIILYHIKSWNHAEIQWKCLKICTNTPFVLLMDISLFRNYLQCLFFVVVHRNSLDPINAGLGWLGINNLRTHSCNHICSPKQALWGPSTCRHTVILSPWSPQVLVERGTAVPIHPLHL